MDILHTIEDLMGRPAVVLTMGKFDGLHVAHQALIAGAVARARELGVQSAVISFYPDPDTVVGPNPQPVFYLTDRAEKERLVGDMGADILIVQPFTPEFSRVTAEDFVKRLCELANIKEIHVGEDFAFGYKAKGNLARLKEMGQQYGFVAHGLPALQVEGQLVSSSTIRQRVLAGEVAEAARLLGRPHSLHGLVVQGFRRGRLIGFPTANTAIDTEMAIPANGVYATVTTLPGETKARPSVTNIGTRPTFDNGARSIETYLLDFDDDLYGQDLRVEFIARLRSEQKFDGIEAIKAQLAIDVENARAVLQAANRL